jgi:crotonobetainyl-CoA:carnitine CoA-transferase CaiB-like acyl-CoA transferase
MTHSATSPSPAGALSGLLVADFSRVLAGPLASMFLADLGATVIKVERPEVGDDTRHWGPPYVGSMSTYFTSVNRNKRSVTLDLSGDSDLLLARRLASRADILIENFMPGKMAEFGLDLETLHATNPRLVYCSISGFGAGSELPGYDFVVQALGGLMSVTGQPGSEPTKVGVALVDVLTGLHATIGMLAALHEREASGRGQHVEVNLLSSLISSLINQAAGYINGAAVPTQMGNQHPSIAPYETLATKDAPLAVAVGNDRQFQVFAAAIGRAALAEDERFATNRARVVHRGELLAALDVVMRAETAQTWTDRLQAVGIPCGPVNDIAAALDLAAGLGLDPLAGFAAVGSEPAVATLSSPLRLGTTPVRYDRPPPALGVDSDEVREWLVGDGAVPLDDPAPQ